MRFAPNWVSAPGETIIDILEDRDISVSVFSNLIGEDLDTIENLLAGNQRIERDLASKLTESLGFSKEFWIRRDQLYFQRKAELEEQWLNCLPLAEMKKQNLVEKGQSVIDSCFEFFGVGNLSEWNSKYRTQFDNLVFR